MSLVFLLEGKPVAFSQAELRFDIDQLAHEFRVSIPHRVITKVMDVEFLLNNERVFRGRVDVVSDDLQADSHSLSLAGRSLSANMIDSTITMDAQYNKTLSKLIGDIAPSFGLSVRSDVDESSMPTIEEFQINAESPVDNFAQLAKERGIILIERDGVITLEKPAHSSLSDVVLSVGQNIEALSLSRNFANQYYHIEVRGQWSDAHAVVTYAPANTQRTRVILSDQLQDKRSCLIRAEYERDLAIARGMTASTRIPGVFNELTGEAINRTVYVLSDEQGIREDMLIKSITLSVSDSEAITQVELCRPFEEIHV